MLIDSILFHAYLFDVDSKKTTQSSDRDASFNLKHYSRRDRMVRNVLRQGDIVRSALPANVAAASLVALRDNLPTAENGSERNWRN